MRHKEINLLNFPSALKYVYDFVYSLVRSEKLKSRITVRLTRGLIFNNILSVFILDT